MEAPALEVHRDQPHASASLIQSFFTSATLLNMQSWEIAKHGNSSHNPGDSSTNFSNRLSPNTQIHLPFHLYSPNTLSLSNEDDAREFQRSIVFYDKRLRRLISNRESARRSRMRRKQQIEELQSQVNQLQTIDRQLPEKLINLLESNHEILQENAQLKEKVSTLQIVLADVFTPLRNLEDASLSQKHKSAS